MKFLSLTLGFLLLAGSAAGGQAPAPPPAPAAPVPSATDGPAATYRIGLEDQIKLNVSGDDQLTNEYRVEADGGILLPLVGTVMAQGLTTLDLQERIRTTLIAKDLLRNPQVRVEVSKYGSQFVVVQGEVRLPQRLAMTGPMRLMEAIVAAGSPTANASVIATIARKPAGNPEGDAEIIPINLGDLLRGVANTNIWLQGGDIINVPKTEVFYVQGHVKNVGVQNWEPGLTIDQAITKAGGLTDRGKRTGLKVSRKVNGRERQVDVKPTDFVQPNDTIIVPSKLF